MKKTLATIAVSSIIIMSNCTKDPEDYIQGEVIEEFGTIAGLVESSGALFGNESVKIGRPSYGINVRTKEGVYTIEIDVTDRCGSSGPKTAYNLEGAIKKGTKVNFPRKAYGVNDECQPAGFSGKIGFLDPDDIEIIDKE